MWSCETNFLSFETTMVERRNLIQVQVEEEEARKYLYGIDGDVVALRRDFIKEMRLT